MTMCSRIDYWDNIQNFGMPACVLTPLFVKAAQRIHNMDEETIRAVVDGFLGGIPMATLSARTGVPNEVLNRLFTLQWRAGLTVSGSPKVAPPQPEAPPALDPTTLQAVADLAKCRIPKDTIRDYLRLKPAAFEAYWKAVMESRRSTGLQSTTMAKVAS